MDFVEIFTVICGIFSLLCFLFVAILEKLIIPRIIKKASLLTYSGPQLPIKNGYLEFKNNPLVN